MRNCATSCIVFAIALIVRTMLPETMRYQPNFMRWESEGRSDWFGKRCSRVGNERTDLVVTNQVEMNVNTGNIKIAGT